MSCKFQNGYVDMRKCSTLENVYGLQQYSTISSDCVSSYSRMSCFAHDDDWNTYGPDEFVCNATGKNCTSKIDDRPLTLSEGTPHMYFLLEKLNETFVA